MHTYLLTWNPRKKGADGTEWLEAVVRHLGRAQSKWDQWSTGTNKRIVTGDRVFLLRQGGDNPGIIGSGHAASDWFDGAHWDPPKRALRLRANYVEVAWDAMLLPESVLGREELLKGYLLPSWVNAQSSGREIPGRTASRLEKKWARHLKTVYSKASGRQTTTAPSGKNDDTYDDLGSENPPKSKRLVSGVKRDPRVRRKVIKRSNRTCERGNCGASRDYPGFIDIHHILGAAKSDRVWNCVALCPNCHRESHYAPNRKAINRQLLKFAARFR